MPLVDFDTNCGRIEIRENTDKWGWYFFNFPACSSEAANDGALPYGATIASVSIKAYEGNVKSSDIISTLTTFDSIIESGTPATYGATGVKIKFQMPHISRKGTRATLVINLTLQGDAKYPFYFPYVYVA